MHKTIVRFTICALWLSLKSLYAEAFYGDISNYYDHGSVHCKRKTVTLSAGLASCALGPMFMKSLKATSCSTIGPHAPLKPRIDFKSSFCQRISSEEAASFIRDAYEYECKDGGENEECNSLLVITSDASRGANRLTGLSAILREIGYCSKHSNANANESGVPRKLDNLHIATRRMHTKNAKDIFKSEVAAIALGVKTVLHHVPLSGRRIIFLTDSASAIDFYCGTMTNNVSREDGLIPTTILNDPHFKAMQSLIHRCQTLPLMAKVKSNKLQSDGFFDHDATDIISSFVKGVANKDVEQMYMTQTILDTESRVKSRRRSMEDDCTHDSCNSNPPQSPSSTRQVFAPPLKGCDIEFLSTSEEKIDKLDQVKKPQIVLKRQRGMRLDRTKSRMRKELGVDPVKQKERSKGMR